MQVHKVILTIIDHDELGADEIKLVIEEQRYPNRCIWPSVVDIESAEIGQWDDGHPLNNSETSDAEWRKIFPSLVQKGDQNAS